MLAATSRSGMRAASEQRSQFQPRLVHLRLRRAFRDAERFGDLAMLQSLDVMQQERRAAPLRELRQRPAPDPSSPPSRSAIPRLPASGQHRLVVQRIGHLPGPRRPAAQVIEALIRRQAVQPRAERRFAAKSVQLPVRRQENLLQQVLGVGRVSHHPQHQAVQPPACAR